MRPLRERLSAVKAQVLTLTRLREAGFFVPYPYADSVPKRLPPYPEVEAIFAELDEDIEQRLAEMAQDLGVFGETVEKGSLDWGVGMFPPLDAMATYSIVKRLAPKRILEIGSGSSTKVLERALLDSGSGGSIVCIDPEPRRSIEHLGVEFERRVLSVDDAARLDSFEANDVLFIDSSHIMVPGIDVDIQFNRMFPRLKPGVVVHLHDIFLPDDYPPDWRPRWYSEQNALIGWIVSGYFEVLYPGHYVKSRFPDRVEHHFGRFEPIVERPGTGSLWLRRAGSGPTP